MWQLRCIATWGYSTPRQLFSVFTQTPIPSSACRFLSYSVLLLTPYVTLWPWPLTNDPVVLTFDLLTSNMHTASAVMLVKVCTEFLRNRVIGGGVIAISIFDLMTLNLHQLLRSRMDEDRDICTQVVTWVSWVENAVSEAAGWVKFPQIKAQICFTMYISLGILIACVVA